MSIWILLRIVLMIVNPIFGIYIAATEFGMQRFGYSFWLVVICLCLSIYQGFAAWDEYQENKLLRPRR